MKHGRFAIDSRINESSRVCWPEMRNCRCDVVVAEKDSPQSVMTRFVLHIYSVECYKLIFVAQNYENSYVLSGAFV